MYTDHLQIIYRSSTDHPPTHTRKLTMGPCKYVSGASSMRENRNLSAPKHLDHETGIWYICPETSGSWKGIWYICPETSGSWNRHLIHLPRNIWIMKQASDISAPKHLDHEKGIWSICPETSGSWNGIWLIYPTCTDHPPTPTTLTMGLSKDVSGASPTRENRNPPARKTYHSVIYKDYFGSNINTKRSLYWRTEW